MCLGSVNYKVWPRITGAVVVSDDVTFNEYKYLAKSWFQSDYDSDRESRKRSHEDENHIATSGDPYPSLMKIDAVRFHPATNTKNAETDISPHDSHVLVTE